MNPHEFYDHLAEVIAKNDELETEALLIQGLSLNVYYTDGSTPLLLATSMGSRHNIVALLLEAGAEAAMAHKKTGVTPLMNAVFNGEMDTTLLLIKSGANVNAVAREHIFAGQGKTAIEIALKQGHADIVDLFKTGGPQPLQSHETGRRMEFLENALGIQKPQTSMPGNPVKLPKDPYRNKPRGRSPGENPGNN